MPTTPWRPKIEIYVNGEEVSADVANRPIKQLATQTQHLKERVSGLDPASGKLQYSNAPLDSSVLAGDVVYFDEGDECYKPAIAEAAAGLNGEYFAGPRAFAVGMVVAKSSATVGDIVQLGRIKLGDYSLDVDNLIENPVRDPFLSGRYYLSNKIPGKLTRHVVAPSIQIGFFTIDECQIVPIQKDLFDSHRHYSFDLLGKPSASQNYARTGWADFGDNKKWVDYFNKGSAGTPPAIVLCVRANGQDDVASATRVEIYRDADSLLGVEYIDDPDYDDAASGTYPGTIAQLPWPAYGDWISIPNTNLEIAFVRRDATYASSLAVDAVALLTISTDRYKIYLPNDLTGWSNANLLDIAAPEGVRFRYITETQSALNNVFPPIPSESAELSVNGTGLVSGVDFKVSTLGIFWIPAGYTADYTYAPWPHDYSTNPMTPPSADLAKNLRIDFTRSGLGNGNSVVMSLKGVSPIKVQECPTGNPASTGNLQVSIDLALSLSDQDPVTGDTALVSVSGVTFSLGDLVAELVEGSGIKIDRLSTTKSKNVGKLRISRRDMKFEGEVSSISLRNAKQEVRDAYSFIDFLPPTQSPTGITAAFKLPHQDFDPTTIKLKLLGRIAGNQSIAGGGSQQSAIFKVVYHVLREGFVGAQLNESTAFAVQYWNVTFPSAYVATTVLTPEQPYNPTDADAFQITPANLVSLPSSLVALSGGFLAGDIVSVQIDRVRTSASSETDTYGGRVALIGLRWILL